jgi:hypothetical protein
MLNQNALVTVAQARQFLNLPISYLDDTQNTDAGTDPSNIRDDLIEMLINSISDDIEHECGCYINQRDVIENRPCNGGMVQLNMGPVNQIDSVQVGLRSVMNINNTGNGPSYELTIQTDVSLNSDISGGGQWPFAAILDIVDYNGDKTTHTFPFSTYKMIWQLVDAISAIPGMQANSIFGNWETTNLQVAVYQRWPGWNGMVAGWAFPMQTYEYNAGNNQIVIPWASGQPFTGLVRLRYNAGFNPTPPDIQLIALEMIKFQYQRIGQNPTLTSITKSIGKTGDTRAFTYMNPNDMERYFSKRLAKHKMVSLAIGA